ncbi:MAG: hypothetical protein BDTLLHRC_000398, partial [Candidatus Fervidibacter sp.]
MLRHCHQRVSELADGDEGFKVRFGEASKFAPIATLVAPTCNQDDGAVKGFQGSDSG